MLVGGESGKIALHTSSVVMLRAVKGEGLWSSVFCRAGDVEVMSLSMSNPVSSKFSPEYLSNGPNWREQK